MLNPATLLPMQMRPLEHDCVGNTDTIYLSHSNIESEPQYQGTLVSTVKRPGYVFFKKTLPHGYYSLISIWTVYLKLSGVICLQKVRQMVIAQRGKQS